MLKRKLVIIISSYFMMASCQNYKAIQAVTVEDFSEFVHATNYITDAEKFGWSVVQQTVRDFKIVTDATWRYPDGQYPSKPNDPVTQVSYNDAIAYCKWSGTRLPTYSEYWKIASKDHRRINVFYDSILPSKTVNLVGNVWEITEPKNQNEIRLAGGSYLCNKNTCDGTNRERELIVDPMTGNIHVSFAVIVSEKEEL